MYYKNSYNTYLVNVCNKPCCLNLFHDHWPWYRCSGQNVYLIENIENISRFKMTQRCRLLHMLTKWLEFLLLCLWIVVMATVCGLNFWAILLPINVVISWFSQLCTNYNDTVWTLNMISCKQQEQSRVWREDE